jgi:hypothetical protein
MSESGDKVTCNWATIPVDLSKMQFSMGDGWFGKSMPMNHDVVEKARLAAVQAKAALAQAERDYLRSHGFVEEYDYNQEIIRWREPKAKGGNLYARKQAMASAFRYAQVAKREAEQQIAKLKAEHGIEDQPK